MAEQLLNPVLREQEWRLCQQDLLYFLENYWKVQRVGVGYGQFELYDYQREDAEDFAAVHRYADALLGWRAGVRGQPEDSLLRKMRQIRLKARQLGWTTLATGAVFWSAYFHSNHPWLIAAQGQDDASVTLKTQIKAPYQHLPKWMRERGPEITRDGAEDFDFDNGSKIRVIPATASSGRGDAVYGALLDEAAFADEAPELFAAVDPMCYGPMFMFSTANGMGNFFHETWIDSQLSDSIWEGKFRSWKERPDRDDAWYATQVLKYRNKPHLLFQEYPLTAEEAFAKSGRTALPIARIEENQIFSPPQWRYDLGKIAYEESVASWDACFEKHRLPPSGEADLELSVWSQPHVARDEHGRLAYTPNYVVGADVSEGLDRGDFSTIVVIDTNTMAVVASAEAHFPLQSFDLVLEAVGYWYHTAMIGPERNNHGAVPINQLHLRGYPRLYRMDSLAAVKVGDRTIRYGFHTNRATKPKLVTDLAEFTGDGLLRVFDERFLHEARTFLSDGKGGYGASGTNHDDFVMGMGVALQLALDVGQSPAIFYDAEPGPLTMGEVFQVEEKSDAYGTGLAAGIGRGSEGAAAAKHSWTLIPA